jgi:hypothetical protein
MAKSSAGKTQFGEICEKWENVIKMKATNEME